MTDVATRRLGASGLAVSAVGLGCNNFGLRIGDNEATAVVHAALDAGVTLFDTAPAYFTSEEMLGRAIAGRRQDVVIATKFPSPFEPSAHGGGSRHHILRACEGSLRRLATDYIDLYQMHRPDPSTPIDETLRALDDLVHSGKVRYIGCSNFAAWQIADADWAARTTGAFRMISAQNEYSLLNRNAEREILPACQRFGLALLPYFPLASGLLTGKYRRGAPAPHGSRLDDKEAVALLGDRFLAPSMLDTVERLAKVAAEAGVTLLELAIGALLVRDGVASVIAGATTPAQVTANVAAASWHAKPDVLAAIDAATGHS